MTDGVAALDRALHLLGAFDGNPPALSLAELARRSGLHKSTILRLAASLERGGCVIRQADGRFRLGSTLWRLGGLYRQGFRLAEAVRPELAHLSATFGETASFWVREGDSRSCLFRHEPARAVRHALIEGALLPLGQGASALVLRAFSGGNADFDPVREAGHAISHGARDPELAAIAVPVRSRGTLIGALSLSGPLGRFSGGPADAILAALSASAARIAARAPGLDADNPT